MEAQTERSFLAKIFLSPDERRLRAGWRLLLHTLLLFIIAIPTSLILIIASSLLPLASSSLAGNLTQWISVILSVFLARRWFDRRSIKSLGLEFSRNVLKDILAGVGITALMMGLIFLLELAFGWLKVEGYAWDSGTNFWPELGVWVLVFLGVGFNEELLSRGYHLQNLEDGLNTTWAVLLSSAVFGALHLLNPNATWVSAVGIFGAGVFLAYGYLRTRQLWLPVGLHIGWNLFEGPVFGFPVSGLSTFRLLNTTVSGPELLTGGAFGPEAGLALLPSLLLGATLIFLYTKDRLISNK
jgi:hypothetical protein